jgi:hypothetical protein
MNPFFIPEIQIALIIAWTYAGAEADTLAHPFSSPGNLPLIGNGDKVFIDSVFISF